VSDTDELLQEVERRTDPELGETSDTRDVTTAAETPESTTHSGEQTSTADTEGQRSWLPSLPSRPTIMTPRGLGLALLTTVSGFLIAGAIPIVGSVLGGVAGLLGIGAASFVLGSLKRGRYVELAVSGATTGAVAFFLDRLLLSVVGNFAVPLTLVGGAAGLFAAVIGLYLGRDLRDGVTRDI